MYHSSALLLPDGTVLISGSNPNAALTLTGPFPTEFRTQIFNPHYLQWGVPRNVLWKVSSFQGRIRYRYKGFGFRGRAKLIPKSNPNTALTLTGPFPSGLYPTLPAVGRAVQRVLDGERRFSCMRASGLSIKGLGLHLRATPMPISP